MITTSFWFQALVNAGGLLGLVAFGLIIADKLSKMVYGPRGPQGSTGSTSSVYTPEERIATLEIDNARHLKLIDSLDKQISSCLKLIDHCIVCQSSLGRSLPDEAPVNAHPTKKEAKQESTGNNPILAANAVAAARDSLNADRDRATVLGLGNFNDIEARIKNIGEQVKHSCTKVDGNGCKACASGKKKYRTVGKTFAEALTDGGS